MGVMKVIKAKLKIRRNPAYTGNHVNASVTLAETTFESGTKVEDMPRLFEAEEFNMTLKNGDVHQVVEVVDTWEVSY